MSTIRRTAVYASIMFSLSLFIVGRALAVGHSSPQQIQAFPTLQIPNRVVLPVVQASEVRSSQLGTFRQDPTLIVTTGEGNRSGYSPAGLPNQGAALSLYGPSSRLRAIPGRVSVTATGIGGERISVGIGSAILYPDPNLYRDTTLLPTRFEIRPDRGVTRGRNRFSPYMLHQR